MSASVWEPGSELVTIDAESTNLSQVFTATDSQVIFNLTLFSYAVGTGSLAVYRGGQRLILGTDWSETSSTSISLTGFTVAAGEIIEVVAVIGAASAASITAQAAADAAESSASEAAASAASIDTASLLTKAGNLNGLASAGVARTNLGLDSPANYPTLNQNTTGNAATATTAANLLGRAQLGSSTTATQNFTLTAEAVNGTMKLARGNAGSTTQDILTVDADGKISATQGYNDVLGSGQTWQNMTGVGGRAQNANITNSTGRPIQVVISGTMSNGSTHLILTVGGIAIVGQDVQDVAGQYATISAIVPNGTTYTLSTSLGTITITNWAELR